MARSRTLAYEGGGGLLTSLQNQWIRWRPPVLEVLVPSETELHLAGRGIALVPSVFVGQRPSLHEHLNDAKAAPWLVLPVAEAGIDHVRLWAGPRSGGRGSEGTALAALLGRTRAAASQHASVLRGAGLIVTRRQGGAVLHLLTPLGTGLLEAG